MTTSPDLPPPIPAGWKRILATEIIKPYYAILQEFVARERRRGPVYPPSRDVFTALRLVPLSRVRVVVLGQDPYPGPGQAHGLAFSVRPGVPVPASLANVYRELAADIGCRIPNNGCLTPWARQGVLLLNTVLTVRAHAPGSHRGAGWERLTGAIIEAASAASKPVVFVLWGRDAQARGGLIDASRHAIVRGAHPSPMSAFRGFLGTRPFSRINAALRSFGGPAIDWQIPDR